MLVLITLALLLNNWNQHTLWVHFTAGPREAILWQKEGSVSRTEHSSSVWPVANPDNPSSTGQEQFPGGEEIRSLDTVMLYAALYPTASTPFPFLIGTLHKRNPGSSTMTSPSSTEHFLLCLLSLAALSPVIHLSVWLYIPSVFQKLIKSLLCFVTLSLYFQHFMSEFLILSLLLWTEIVWRFLTNTILFTQETL